MLQSGSNRNERERCRDMNCFVVEKRNVIIDMISVPVFSD
jgi:hypothetical protein